MSADADLKRVEAKLLEAINMLYDMRARGPSAVGRWVSIKVAAREIGKSVRVTRYQAKKIPGCVRMHGGRCQVDLDLIQLAIVKPPTARRRW